MTCRNARDTITQDAGVVLGNHYDYPDNAHKVTSYCRTADGTWVAWINQIQGDDLDLGFGDQNKADWPANIASAYAIGVGFFPDDGSGPVVYELGVDPIFNWHRIIGRTVKICDYWFVVGDVFSDWGCVSLHGWSMNVLDVQIRTDGTNVWVAVLAQEAVKYPFLYLPPDVPGHVDHCGITHPSMGDLGNAYANSWGDAFSLDGVHWWLYGAGIVGGNEEVGFNPGVLFGPYDDPGQDDAFRWEPCRVTVFGGDIGGFTKIDTVEAKFDNMRGSASLISGLEAAASPAEPGVLHVMWSEGGNFGTNSVDPQRGQRINYSQWSSSAKILDTDLAYAAADGYGLAAEAEGLSPLMVGDEFVFTAEMILRNDHGSPIAIVWPWITGLDEAGTTVVPLNPTTTPEFWDLSTGAAVVLQTADATLVPTAGEVGAGLTPDGDLVHEPGLDFTPRRMQFASSLYTDPTLDDRDVYLICASFGSIHQGEALAFYRIPCDGSDGFDYMDGVRKVGYSIIGNSLAVADFVSDPDNVWMPADASGGGFIRHLTRRCTPTWEFLPAFPIPDPTKTWMAGEWAQPGTSTSQPVIFTDDAGDWIAGGGVVTPTASPYPVEVASLKAKICRCCVPCTIRGIHLWKRV